MTTPPLARVGDVIEHGQPIPPNVRELSDSSSTNGWGRWVRSINGLWNWAPTADDVESAELRVGGCREHDMTDPDSACAPYRVEAVSYNRPPVGFGVDPEPQPAETETPEQRAERHALDRPLIDAFDQLADEARQPVVNLTLGPDADEREADDWHLMQALGVNRLDEVMPAITAMRAEVQRLQALASEPADPGPLVLSLPQVPDGAVALVGNNDGRRYVRSPQGLAWQDTVTGQVISLMTVLGREQPEGVTVEMAPAREPRTWPKLDDVEPDEWPAVVDVTGWGRWVRTETGYMRPGDSKGKRARRTLSELRTRGEVREVLS